jgi:hypothetical protein
MWLSARGAAPFALQPNVDVVIGRGGDCNLSLYSTMLSREHACIRWEHGIPVLFDLDSLNGTFIGPMKVHRHRLRDGDVIRLADVCLLFKIAPTPPPPPDEIDLELPPTSPEPDLEPSHETRLYSRTQVLHQKVFDYDELAALATRLGERLADLQHPALRDDDVVGWLQDVRPDEAQLWHYLALGVLVPRDHGIDLRRLSLEEVAARCKMAKRAHKLLAQLEGHKSVWNEIAALRYQARQGILFQPLRSAARAYRPGGGLLELTVGRLVDEVESIYAPELARPPIEQELRRLQVIGFLCPAKGKGREAWYPDDWSDGSVIIAPRGMAMLEGFRLED